MDSVSPDDPVDETSFRDALETVVETAHRNGVAVERDWACRTEGDAPDWVVDIVRLEPDDSSDES